MSVPEGVVGGRGSRGDDVDGEDGFVGKGDDARRDDAGGGVDDDDGSILDAGEGASTVLGRRQARDDADVGRDGGGEKHLDRDDEVRDEVRG